MSEFESNHSLMFTLKNRVKNRLVYERVIAIALIRAGAALSPGSASSSRCCWISARLFRSPPADVDSTGPWLSPVVDWKCCFIPESCGNAGVKGLKNRCVCIFIYMCCGSVLQWEKMSTRTPLPTVNERDTENVSHRLSGRCFASSGGFLFMWAPVPCCGAN